MAEVTYQLEQFDDCFAEAQSLLAAHYDEIAEEKEILALDPDIDTYHTLENIGALRILTARHDGILIGYYVGIVRVHLHYRTILCGSDDIYFIAPEHRRGLVGYRLFRRMFEIFREAGCRLVTARTKVAHDNGPLLARLGMRPFEHLYIMRL